MPDMITHRQNGYLAKPFNTDDLAAGIQWILDGDSWQLLSKNARAFVESECTLEIQANRYNEIYQSILG
jgi:glycosyltransferase involved in cell wall biosynthesis